MKKVFSVEEYIESNPKFKEELNALREIILSTELDETIKWSAPVYTLNGKNVIGLGAFKNHFGIWFFNGVFLKDQLNLLINAQENKTKALRQMRLKHIDEINRGTVLAYVKEAIENQKQGLELRPERTKKQVIIPKELQIVFDDNKELNACFKTLTPSKQREYCEHIDSAKRTATKESRLQKIIPMIMQGVGLNDKYKNC